jgi:hypothetical protein
MRKTTMASKPKAMDRFCLFCNKELGPAFDSDSCHYQPEDGGEVIFSFCFGSAKFDKAIGTTEYHGVICDDCAEGYVSRMEQRLFDMNAKPWSQEIQDGINQERKKTYGPFITDRPELQERGIVSKMPGKSP